MLSAGTVLGPYRILAPLGAGGMGEVYRAHDTRLGRDVALKVIPAGLARDPDRIRRFEQEARAAGALNHPNVCAIFDIGAHDGSPFVVMELLEGESLRARLDDGPIPARKAIDWAAQAARGLAAAHAKGIVHRDLKPENLFLTRGRLRQGAGLRPGEADAARDPRRVRRRACLGSPDRDRRDPGHHRLHGAGAGAMRARGPPRGPVRAWLGPVRTADGPAGVHGGNLRRDLVPHPERRPARRWARRGGSSRRGSKRSCGVAWRRARRSGSRAPWIWPSPSNQ